MTTKLLLGKDLNGNVTYQIPFTDTGYYANLIANTVTTLTVPANATSAWFSYSPGVNVFVDPITTATVPSSSFGPTTCDLNPVARSVTGGTTLSFISNTAAYVKVSFYEGSNGPTGLS